jgi:heme/copper-type cytochrome/quinol oxidase subunit 2
MAAVRAKLVEEISHAEASLKFLIRFFSTAHALIAVLFVAMAVFFLVMAARAGWDAIGDDPLESSTQAIEAVGLLAIAVVSLQIAQTITEEEVIRDAHISAPTRVRRYLSRFLVVVVVALAVEGLVGTFKFLHEDPELLPEAASILIAAAALLAAWGVFVRFNRAAEELEPEAMEEAKKEDAKLSSPDGQT